MHNPTVTLAWMRAGQALVEASAVGRLCDTQLRGPSLLPDWTRAHVVGHLSRNAEALGRLARWARTGVETPMYADPGQRATDIETSAALPAEVLRADLIRTAAELESALDTLDPVSWQAQVRSALGRAIPVTELPWMRVREVWIHAVDLDAGITFNDLPPTLVDALLDDLSTTMSARPNCPAIRLRPLDRTRTWRLGPAAMDAVDLRGNASHLLGWLAGRGQATQIEGVTGRVPPAPGWI
jgi:maleylpyruvate isomerase